MSSASFKKILFGLFVGTTVCISQALGMVPYELKDLNSCLKVFQEVTPHTMPDLLDQAQKGDERARSQLKLFMVAVEKLPQFGYQSKGRGTDKAIEGVNTFFAQKKGDVQSVFLQACLKSFHGVDRNTLPNLLKVAQEGTQPAAVQLSLFEERLKELAELGYVPRNSGVDKAVTGVKTFFEFSRKDVDEVYRRLILTKEQKKGASCNSLPPIDVKNKKTYPSSQPHERKEIFDENLQVYLRGHITTQVHYLHEQRDLVKHTQRYGSGDQPFKADPILKLKKPFQSTKVMVVDADTVDHALFLKRQGHNPLAVDLANARMAGGGASTGQGNTQEENEIYRAPALYMDLENNRQWAMQNKDLGAACNFIPLNGGILCRDVPIIRENSKLGYVFKDQVETLDFGVVAALHHSDREKEGKESDIKFYPQFKDEQLYWECMESKIRTFFVMALENKNTIPVFGALGCGVFRNPRDKVMDILERVLQDFAGCFEEVHIAILANGNTNDPNYKDFSQRFHQKIFGGNN